MDAPSLIPATATLTRWIAGTEVVLIDTGVGVGTEEVLKNLEKDGVAAARISTLLLTHAHLDHSGGAHWLKEKLALKVVSSTETAATMRSADEEAISLGAAKRAGIYEAEMHLQACAVAVELCGGERWSLRRCDCACHTLTRSFA